MSELGVISMVARHRQGQLQVFHNEFKVRIVTVLVWVCFLFVSLFFEYVLLHRYRCRVGRIRFNHDYSFIGDAGKMREGQEVQRLPKRMIIIINYGI